MNSETRLKMPAWMADSLAGPQAMRVTEAGQHALDRGWSVSHRSLDEHLFWFINSGRAVGRIGRQEHKIGPGSCMWLAPGTPFEFTLAAGGREIRIARFRLMTAPGPRRSWLVQHEAWHLQALMAQLITLQSTDSPHRAMRQAGLAAAMIGAMLDGQKRKRLAGRQFTEAQQAMIVQWVNGDPRHRFSAAELADRLGLTHDYFSRLFKSTFGQAPRSWLVEQRIRRAAVILGETDRAVGKIAADLGYEDVFLFSRQFQRVMGTAPTRYRATQRSA